MVKLKITYKEISDSDDSIIQLAYSENDSCPLNHIQDKLDELRLIKRLEKFKVNHLLFAYVFTAAFTNKITQIYVIIFINECYQKIYNKFITEYQNLHINLWYNISKEELESIIKKFLSNKMVDNDYSFEFFTNLIIKKIICLTGYRAFSSDKLDLLELLKLEYTTIGEK